MGIIEKWAIFRKPRFLRYIAEDNCENMGETMLLTDVVLEDRERPSLLRQIVDAADSLDEEGQAAILKKIKLQKALQLAEKADRMLEGNTLNLSEEEIAEMISTDRKKKFDEKIGH